MGKKRARLMARIVALEEAMALMLRGSLSHGIKKKAKAGKVAAKKPAAKKAAAKKPKKAMAKKNAKPHSTAAIPAPATVKPSAVKPTPMAGPQTTMPPRPAPATH